VTVGVAALATFGTPGRPNFLTIVVDRMITRGRKIEYELPDQTKVYPLNDNGTTVAVVSGSTDSIVPVCRRTRDAVLRSGSVSVGEMAEIFREHFAAVRTTEVERRSFSKYGLTIPSFVAQQDSFPAAFREKLDRAINDPEADLGHVIIAGIDQQDASAHIYTVADPAELYPWDASGFVAVGSGDELAEGVFIAAQYTPARNWLDALIIAFFSKKAAESAVGVGPHTDLYYIHAEGCRHFTPHSPTVVHLEALFKEKTEAERNALAEHAQSLYTHFARQQGGPDVQLGVGEERGDESVARREDG
jgi:hypothetical protein